MGVQIYLLNRQTITLAIGHKVFDIGSLRSFWKITEIDSRRKREMDSAAKLLETREAPPVVMVASAEEMRLACEPNRTVNAHLVLGWDSDRFQVSDLQWDYLPVLGYGVMREKIGVYELHEAQNDLLTPMSDIRAGTLGILDHGGKLLRRGQPHISECLAVKPFLSNYVQADVVFDDGREVEILTFIETGKMPSSDWYLGKRPVDTDHYPSRV